MTRVRSTRDRREPHDLRVGEREFAGVREQEVGGRADWTRGPTPRSASSKRRRSTATIGAGRWLCSHRSHCCRICEKADCAKESSHGVLPLMGEKAWRWSVGVMRANPLLLFSKQLAVSRAA